MTWEWVETWPGQTLADYFEQFRRDRVAQIVQDMSDRGPELERLKAEMAQVEHQYDKANATQYRRDICPRCWVDDGNEFDAVKVVPVAGDPPLKDGEVRYRCARPPSCGWEADVAEERN